MWFFPLTGLPRSGSTLLMSILAQNERFHVSADSSLSPLIIKAKTFLEEETYGSQIPYQILHECTLDYCRNGSKAWKNTLCQDKILLDKSRTWCHNFDFIYKVFPDMKSLVIVRDLRGVCSSFEKRHDESLIINRGDFNYALNSDISLQRVDRIFDLWFFRESLISIKDMIESNKKYQDNVFFVKYEDLVINPKNTINQIYDFLELESFGHDFDNISCFPGNDNVFQPYGCHRIKSNIDKEYDPFIFTHLNQKQENYIMENCSWYYEEFYPEVL